MRRIRVSSDLVEVVLKANCALFVHQVLLRDLMDDNVIPLVEELRRRLPLASTSFQGQEEEDLGAQNDAEASEENGKLQLVFSFWGLLKIYSLLFYHARF